MDDLEIRRKILSDPKQRNDELLEAINNNESHSKFYDDVLDLDEQIKQAMNVDVPEDLADKILFSQTSTALESNVVKPNFIRRSMAMAATVAFTAGLLLGQVNWGNVIVSPAHASLMDTAISHVVSERPFIDPLDEEVSSRQINMKMIPFAYQFTEAFPYHVYYLNHCGFGQSNAMHMVFQGEKGRVTLFITGMQAQESFDFEKDGLTGVVSKMDKHTFILVGEQGEDVEAMSNRLMAMMSPMS